MSCLWTVLCVTMIVLPSITFAVQFDGIQERIIGGTDCTSRGSSVNTKFMVSLRILDTEEMFYQHFCGGSLINKYWVLTAAHCQKNDSVIYVVENYRIKDIEYTGPVVKVKQRFAHEFFNNTTNIFDIALLKLSTPIDVNSKVGFVKLPTKPILGDLYDKLTESCPMVTEMGWGQMYHDSPYFPSKIRCVDLNIIRYSECQSIHSKLNKTKVVYYGNVCTESTYSKDFWRGDSGGPLMCGDTQYGIMSWGYGAEGLPSVYVRVDLNLYFINCIIENMSQPN